MNILVDYLPPLPSRNNTYFAAVDTSAKDAKNFWPCVNVQLVYSITVAICSFTVYAEGEFSQHFSNFSVVE